MKVKLHPAFARHLLNFPKDDQDKIRQFILHVERYGLTGLVGRNKPSNNVPKDDPKWLAKVQFASRHNLWHYHIGIPCYTGRQGDKTSRYVLHYRLEPDAITLLLLNAHPPFELPTL